MVVLFEWYYISGIIGVIIGVLWILKRRYPKWTLSRELAYAIICIVSFYIGMIIGSIFI